jgi:hypothetical protein
VGADQFGEGVLIAGPRTLDQLRLWDRSAGRQVPTVYIGSRELSDARASASTS